MGTRERAVGQGCWMVVGVGGDDNNLAAWKFPIHAASSPAPFRLLRVHYLVCYLKRRRKFNALPNFLG